MSDPSPWVQSHCMMLHKAECFFLESNNEILPSDRPWMNPPLSSLSFSLSPSFPPPSSLILSSQSDIFPIAIRRKFQCRENKSFLFLMVKEKILRPKKKKSGILGLGLAVNEWCSSSLGWSPTSTAGSPGLWGCHAAHSLVISRRRAHSPRVTLQSACPAFHCAPECRLPPPLKHLGGEL